MNSTLPRIFSLLAACAALGAHAYNHTAVLTPQALGPLNVACSNIEQDTSKLAPGAAPSDYWDGFPVNGTDHYVDEILAHPGAPFEYPAPVPDQSSLYPGHAGQNVTFVALVCYPTPAANADPNYTLPDNSGNVVPHMALPGAAPKLESGFEYQVRMTATSRPSSRSPRRASWSPHPSTGTRAFPACASTTSATSRSSSPSSIAWPKWS